MGRLPYSVASPRNNNNYNNSNSYTNSPLSRQWFPPPWLQNSDSVTGTATAATDRQGIAGLLTGAGNSANNSNALIASTVSSTATKGGSGGSQFVLPIPAVPEPIANEISAKVSTSVQPFTSQETRIRNLTAKKNDQKERLTAWEEKLAELENQKEVALSDIIAARRKEKDEAVAAVEVKLRTQYEEEVQIREKKYREELEDECNQKRKVLVQKHELACKEEKEQAQKRLRLLTAAAEAGDGTNEQQQLLLLLDDTNNEQVQAAKKRIEEKRAELIELEKQLEFSNDSRSEMIWLLKQVIKAEEKQKIRLDTKQETITTGLNCQSNRQA